MTERFNTQNQAEKNNKHMHPLMVLLWLIVGGFLSLTMLIVFLYAMVNPYLPNVEPLLDYSPKMPLRVWTEDKVLIGEFGVEKRNLIPFTQIPKSMKQAVLAAEDDRFYEHGGVDFSGIARAFLANLRSAGSQGASTITMQVARNFFLSNEKTVMRKIYEIFLSYKIEHNLSKDKILELYMNQIYLGQRSYGFASASQIYYGVHIKNISIAQAAMLAGLPKAPSAYNPIVNYDRAKLRQRYVLRRMLELGYITSDQHKKAVDETLIFKNSASNFTVHAEYIAEKARQIAYEAYGEDVYSRGMNIYTTLNSKEQQAAYESLRRGVMSYTKRHGYTGPEAFVEEVKDIETILEEYPDNDDLLAAVVLEANNKQVVVARTGNTSQNIIIKGDGLRFVGAYLGNSSNAKPNKTIRRGAIIRIIEEHIGASKNKKYTIVPLPEVESAFVSADSETGAVRSYVGGFDYRKNKFDHVLQAWRQPGSTFKPFVYSASFDKKFTPETIVDDAPITIPGAAGQPNWSPKNYDSRYEGPIPLRRALAKSKNMVTIRVGQAIGVKYIQDYIRRFGFMPEKHEAYLPMVLGSGSVTVWQMVGAYAVFANNGYRINPYFIQKITDNQGRLISQANPVKAGDERNRVLNPRNAYLMDVMLKEIVTGGTAVKAMSLGRNDLAGKTGTTNESKDAWFAGYQPKLVAVAWMGFDQAKKLGDHETGGVAALPIWIDYMKVALAGKKEITRSAPEGLYQSPSSETEENIDDELDDVDNENNAVVSSEKSNAPIVNTINTNSTTTSESPKKIEISNPKPKKEKTETITTDPLAQTIAKRKKESVDNEDNTKNKTPTVKPQKTDSTDEADYGGSGLKFDGKFGQ